MRVLVSGGTGMLGGAVVRAARRRGWPALGLSHQQCDLTQPPQLARAMATFAPELVINCAAFTAVDRCESERELAFAVNATGVGNLAEACAVAGTKLVQVSSDYVFAGDAKTPYREDSATGPLSVYGASKLEGEQRALALPSALVVRASWLFGPGGSSFPATMLRLVDQGRVPLRVVDDQVGCPTYTPFLAEALLDLAARDACGIVHYANREPVSWCGFAREVVRLGPKSAAVDAISTDQFPRPAQRPAYSVLATDHCESLLGRRLETWIAGLASFVTDSWRSQ